jgi:hypothetical protein
VVAYLKEHGAMPGKPQKTENAASK